MLDRLLLDLRRGHSRVLVLRGEAGVGKTALLDHLTGRVPAGHVVRTVGVETGSEIAYSALRQLCVPLLDRLDRLPVAQRAALVTALELEPEPTPGRGPGPSTGESPDCLLTGLAVLGLFAEAAVGAPLVCVVDDAQWIDGISVAVLAFVARRLDAEAVALVFAVTTSAPTLAPTHAGLLAGLPELRVDGLRDEDARAVLASVLPGPVDPRVRDAIVAEARGNPLALAELARGADPVGKE